MSNSLPVGEKRERPRYKWLSVVNGRIKYMEGVILESLQDMWTFKK